MNLLDLLISYRFVVCLLTFIATGLTYASRVALSVAIVAMTVPIPHKTNDTEYECTVSGNNTNVNSKGTFKWDETTQAWVLSGFYYGYSILQIPSGMLCDRFGGRNMMLFAISTTSVLTFITPFAAYCGPVVLIILRVIEGACEASVFSAMLVLFSHWCCTFESTTYIGIAMSGCYVGTMASQLACGYLSQLTWLDGWPLPFYILGIVGIIWCGFWYAFVKETPSECKFISDTEKEYIINNGNNSPRVYRKIPWIKILTCLPLFGTLFGSCALSFNTYVIMSSYPTFLSNVFGINIQSNGILNAFPFLSFYFGTVIFSYVTDLLRTRLLSTKWSRILVFTFGTLLSSLCNALVKTLNCNLQGVETLICISLFFCAAMQQIAPNLVEMFPIHLGIAYGIMSTVSNAMGILSPYIADIFTQSNIHSRTQWQNVFYFDDGLMLIFGLIFVVLISDQPQVSEEYSPMTSLLSHN